MRSSTASVVLRHFATRRLDVKNIFDYLVILAQKIIHKDLI